MTTDKSQMQEVEIDYYSLEELERQMKRIIAHDERINVKTELKFFVGDADDNREFQVDTVGVRVNVDTDEASVYLSLVPTMQTRFRVLQEVLSEAGERENAE